MPKSVSPSKKLRLTLEQLTSYDDILTDALVDHVYYWTSIRKNKMNYHSSRGFREEDVTAILQKRVIVENDPAKAEQELLALPGLKKFSNSLKSEKEKDDFRKHLRKYINIYMPDCPFEVSSTNRYTVVTKEAAVTARKFIKKGETVKYLTGIQIILTDEEMAFLKSSRRDFSIVVSSRKKSTSLFLGPARFANHDCASNARLTTKGRDGMDIIAVQDIEIGDEITVSYGDDYFGVDNCECLCFSCEKLCETENVSVSGWTPDAKGEDKVVPKLSIEEELGNRAYSFRQRRRRESSFSSSRDASMTPDVIVRPRVKRTPRSLSRFQNNNSPLRKSPSTEPEASPLKRKRADEMSPSPSAVSKRSRGRPTVKTEPSNLSFSVTAATTLSPPASPPENHRESSSLSGTDGRNTTDATSMDEDTIIVEHSIGASPAISRLRRSNHKKISAETFFSNSPITVGENTSLQHLVLQDDSVSSVLSDINSSIFSDEESTMAISLVPTKDKIPTTPSRKRKRKEIRPKTDLDHAPSVRKPGDYVLTPLLLVLPTMAWITCKICEESFVQDNAYFTKSSCPRCERHSKLYGFRYPKTENEEDDDEERVLDHRTVHRFIAPKEERAARKRNRSMTESRATTRDTIEVPFMEEDAVEEKPKKKSRKSSRLTM